MQLPTPNRLPAASLFYPNPDATTALAALSTLDGLRADLRGGGLRGGLREILSK
ncbi:hypothetical protein [Geminisphaera colitermitum]|uniref:hypothetical protein n=1 Tax=Geminisphaera colitermitum TaxID=1148786 RepID=UPI000196503B|nr:hypothetical protein [Geminisphaera colitermitum]